MLNTDTPDVDTAGKKSSVSAAEPYGYDVYNYPDMSFGGTADAGRQSGSGGADGQIDAQTAARAEDILESARTEAKFEAEEIINRARAEASQIKKKAEEEGFAEGFRRGSESGRAEAVAAGESEIKVLYDGFLERLGGIISSIEAARDGVISDHCAELRDIALTVAEKVIHISLKSSGRVIEKMITDAAENSRSAKWVRIHIADFDNGLLVNSHPDIIAAVENASQSIRIVEIEGGEAGSCIAEFPDRIIDYSIGTQLENIRKMLEDNEN